MWILTLISWILAVVATIVFAILIKKATPEDAPKPTKMTRAGRILAVIGCLYLSSVSCWVLLTNAPVNEDGGFLLGALILIGNLLVALHPIVVVFNLLFSAYLKKKDKSKRANLLLIIGIVWYILAVLIAMIYFLIYMLSMILY